GVRRGKVARAAVPPRGDQPDHERLGARVPARARRGGRRPRRAARGELPPRRTQPRERTPAVQRLPARRCATDAGRGGDGRPRDGLTGGDVAGVRADETSVFPRFLDLEYPNIERGEGVWLTTTDGTRVLDASSGGAMVACLGHGVRELA